MMAGKKNIFKLASLAVETRDQVLKFGLVGATNFLVTYCMYLGALWILPPVPSLVLVTLMGTVYTGVLNTNMVFKRSIRLHALLLWGVYYITYSAASAILLHFTIYNWAVSPSVAPMIVIGVTLPINFLCSRAVVIRTGAGLGRWT
jgi:putative flippase GtrA